MAETPRRTVRPEDEPPRTLAELLDIAGAIPGMPFLGEGVPSLYTEGAISHAEARLLEHHARRSAAGQKRALAQPRQATDEQLAKARSDLDDVLERLHQKYPHLNSAQARRAPESTPPVAGPATPRGGE
ncbi:hypothetical protein FBY40_1596 [Microbacterium sp. SLBN-154]|nr:hypothetical protein FBY40_1596 [Microbacterium sp. SLBN-154]